jgi:excisionase family DNA binding protein
MLLSVKQAAERLGVSSGIVYALCAASQLRDSRIGLGRGKIVISEEAIAEYLRAREAGPQLIPTPPPRVRVKLQHLRMPS